MFSPWVRVVMLATQRWRTLRKRDGAPYNADPKRSINASLTKTPAYGQVFERDPHIEGFWRLTPGTFTHSLRPFLRALGVTWW